MRRVIALLACLLGITTAASAVTESAGAVTPPVTIYCTPVGCVGAGQIGPIRVETITTPTGNAVFICVGSVLNPCSIARGAVVITPSFLFAAGGVATINGNLTLTASYVRALLSTPKVRLTVLGTASFLVVALDRVGGARCIIWDGSGLRNVRC